MPDDRSHELMHCGAAWVSSVNRDQIRDCVGLMGKLVPLDIEITVDHPDTLWCDACYPGWTNPRSEQYRFSGPNCPAGDLRESVLHRCASWGTSRNGRPGHRLRNRLL